MFYYLGMCRVGYGDRPMSATNTSLATSLAGETMDWMADDPTREDITDEVWAYALATYIGDRGRLRPIVVTPRGYNVGDLWGPRYCAWCLDDLTDEPAGSLMCKDCFISGLG